ncbi:MAG: acetylxylan esterase [bacterium]|nr:acetylxylan esterase [Candidatus Colisoma equi]
MKTRVRILAGCVFATAVAFGGVLDNAWIKGTTDKDPISYKPGEKMTFTLSAQGLDGELPAGEYFLEWTRSGDDGIRENGKEPLTAKPFVYETKIDKPGFVRLQANVVDKDGKRYVKKFTGDATTPEGKAAMNRFERQNKAVFFDGGAGADIETLRTEPEPKDFDAFWAKQFARLDKVPMKDDRIEVKCANPKARIFAIRIDCAGLRPVTGYLSIPKAVDEGKAFPARLETHGYSGDRCTHGTPSTARDNEIVLNINAHGLKLVEFGATEADTKALRWETRSHDMSYAFDPKQSADPEVAYFNGMVLRVKRALQFLKTVKGWNGKDLIASGGSQGGLQTIWAAACGEGVTRAESGITWNCDIYTNGKLRKDPSLKLAADGWYIPWVDALGYYDAAIFGKRIPKSCRTVITRAGLGDYCCPPTGLAKLWNNIPGNKEILWVQGSQHGYVPPAYEGRDFVRTQE